MQREFQIAMKSPNTIGNLPPVVEPPATVSPLGNEKSSLKCIALDEVPTVHSNSVPDNASESDQVPKNPPPLLRRLDKMITSGDIGADVLPKSANSGLPRLTRNLLLNNEKRSYSSGVIESSHKQKTSSGLLPQEITPGTKSSSLSRQIDGVRLPPVVSVGNVSHDHTSKVKSLPGMYARVNSAKNISEVVNTKPPPSVGSGSKPMIRTPMRMFSSSPVAIGKAAQHQVVSNSSQYSSSPPQAQQNIPQGKPITSKPQWLHRELSPVKSDSSLSQSIDANKFEKQKVEAKSPTSVNDSS